MPTLKEAGFDIEATPQIRGVVAPPQQSAEATAYWIDRFQKLLQTPSWKKYVHDNQMEQNFVPGPAFGESMRNVDKQLREQFIEAGIKVVR